MSQLVESKVAPAQLGETALRDLVDAAFDALVVTRGGEVVFANRSFCEMYGGTQEEIVGRGVLEFVAPSSRAKVMEMMRAEVESRYEAQGVRRDQTTIEVEICARHCIFQGEPARVTAIRYIEDRKRAEEALRRSEARLREVIECLPDMIMVHCSGTITFANRALITYLGYERLDQVVGRPVIDFAHPDDRAAVRERVRLVYEAREPGQLITFRTLRRDGTGGVVEIASAPMEFDGEPAVLAIGRDVAERKQMEARLMQAELLASVGMLAAGITHEINNPLAYILLNLDILARQVSSLLESVEPERTRQLGIGADGVALRRDPRPDPREIAAEITRVLADTRDGAARVKQVVHDFRVFARGGEGRPTTLDVREVLDSTVKLALNELRHRVRLVRNYGPVPLVKAEEARLGQLFLNLLVNALQALPEGASPDEHEIRVATSTSSEGAAVIEVADTGVGIPRHVIGRVFEPFFSTKPVGLGSGLGLSICLSIVHALGGRIEVESELGRGAVFRVVLPAARAIEAAAPDRLVPTPRTRRPRVLLVDDEERLLSALAQALSHEYLVEAATSGAEAIRLIRERAFDVVVCDLMMPCTSGADVYEAALKARPELGGRFVFMTGGAFVAGLWQFLEGVPSPRLEKPFELQQLRDVLDELLGSTR